MDEGIRKRVILFKIGGKKFGIEVNKVKKIIKEKGDIQITKVDGAPPYIIGISEIEITQGEQALVSFIDIRKIIDIGNLEKTEQKEIQEKKYEKKEEEDYESEEKQLSKRRLFMIIPTRKTKDFIGILIDDIEEIEEFDSINSKLYPPPEIKNIKEFFDGIIVAYEGKNKGERIFIINPSKISEFIVE
jgi:chemotaxis signal transduction protein